MKSILRKILPILLAATLMVTAVVLFSGCVDADNDVQTTKLQEAGYNVANDPFSDKIEGCAYRITADIGENIDKHYEVVYIMYFTSEEYAIRYYQNIFLSYSLPNFIDQNEELGSSVVHARYGSIVIYGTQNAVEDALA